MNVTTRPCMPTQNAWLDGTVLIATDSDTDAACIRAGLPDTVEIITVRTTTLATLQREISHYQPQLVLVSVKTAGQALIAALETVLQGKAVPLVLFVSQDPENFAVLSVRVGISAYVVDGLETNRIAPVAKVALERFKLNEALQTELQKSREELVARKLIDQAKGLLMQTKKMSEQDAYAFLRNTAMRQGKPIKQVAENIISVSDLLP